MCKLLAQPDSALVGLHLLDHLWVHATLNFKPSLTIPSVTWVRLLSFTFTGIVNLFFGFFTQNLRIEKSEMWLRCGVMSLMCQGR